MKYFSMPADFKKETIDRYDELNKAYKDSKVMETYGNITVANKMESGRASNQLPRVDLLDLKEYITYMKQKNMDFNYTFNATHMQNREFTEEGVARIMDFFKAIYNAGVRSLTVALPSLIELVKSSPYDFKIKSSTLCQVFNANKALAYKNMGMERIVVDESINRDFGKLKQVVKVFGDKVEMIINPICLKDCTYRMFHYNQISGDSIGKASDISVNYYEHRCVLQRNRNIGNLLRMCWVRPEDLKYYTDIGIHYFKLQGRQLVFTGDAVKTVKAYFDESFDGDLWNIINMFHPINSFQVPIDNKKLDGFIKPFYEKDDFCQRDCGNCNYCENFAKKVIDYKKAEEIIGLAHDFYSDYDKFCGMLESVNAAGNISVEEEIANVDFDI